VKEDHWDPAPHERSYYRHVTTGDLGWMVRREGKDHIKLDRPAQDLVKLFRPEEWIVEQEYRTLTRQQFAQIAFEADKKLCHFLGEHDLARRQWLELHERVRIAWVNMGPGHGLRAKLYAAIMATLQEHAR
jgi:hypothetical protein